MPKKAADGAKPKKSIPESSRTLRSKGAASPIKKSDASDSAALEAERFLNLKSKPSAKPKVTKPKAAAEPKKRKAPAKAKADKEESPKKRMKKAGTMAVTAAEGEKFVEKNGGVEEEKKTPPSSPKKPAPKSPKASTKKGGAKSPKMKKAGTMAVTATEGEKFIEKENERAEKKEGAEEMKVATPVEEGKKAAKKVGGKKK